MKLLIVGCNGMLGTDMLATARASGYECVGIDFPDIDITNSNSVQSVIEKSSPHCIINCAAYTAVDLCESNRDIAFRVNALGAGNLARHASAIGAKMVHISTDYVFDGAKEGHYVETDTPYPKSVYGESKLEGEFEVDTNCETHFTFRIAWLYGAHGNNFVKTITKIAKEKGFLKVVNDQFGSPTWTVDVCSQILTLIGTDHFGLYHCTSEGSCSWFDFASEIVDAYSINAEITPCTTAEFPRPAPRPKFSVLENRHLKELGLNKMRDWREAFREFVKNNHEL